MIFDLYFLRNITPLGKLMVRHLNQKIALKIHGLFSQNDTIKILEIGPGVGTFADVFHAASKKQITYYGVEPNLALCKLGEEKGYHFINATVPPFPDNMELKEFDCVYLSHVLEHFITYPVVVDVIAGISSLLKHNGYMVIMVPDYLDWKDDFFNGDYSHSYITTERRLRELVNDMDFEVVDIRHYRACYTFPQTLLVYPFHLCIKTCAGILYNFFNSLDILFKLKVTFARNILIVCRKK